MSNFDLSAVEQHISSLEAPEFGETLSIPTELVNEDFLDRFEGVVGYKPYFDPEVIKDKLLEETREAELTLVFKSLSSCGYDSKPVYNDGKLVGELLVIRLWGLKDVEGYIQLAEVNSLFQSLKFIADIMASTGDSSMGQRFFSNSFRRKVNGAYCHEYSFAISTHPTTHKAIFGYGASAEEAPAETSSTVVTETEESMPEL